jgi:hypothetical protein
VFINILINVYKLLDFPMASIDSWSTHQQHLLDLEKEAEKEELHDKLQSLTASECQEVDFHVLIFVIIPKK